MTNAANATTGPTTADVLALVAGNSPALRAVNRIFARTAYRPKPLTGRRHTTAAEVERSARHETKINKAIIRLISTVTEAKAATGTKAARAIDAFSKTANLSTNDLAIQLVKAITQQ